MVGVCLPRISCVVYVLVDECELEEGTQHPSGVGDPSIPDGDERVVYGILKAPESWSPFTVQVCERVCVLLLLPGFSL